MADDEIFEVVTNAAGYYSVWPVHRVMPRGWRGLGFRGSREACLAHVAQVWRGL